jgi:tRNA (guanine-N7-)-methyltransferase
MRNRRWTWLEIMGNGLIVKSPARYKGRWNEFFGNFYPVHIEIGCGKGRFVNGMSTANPKVNYVALEREENVLVVGAKTARENGAKIAFIIGDARDLGEYFAPGDVSRVYVNFCDPWPNKKKWAKRRLTHANFLDIYALISGDGGELFFKTDNEFLFDFSVEQLVGKGWELFNVTRDSRAGGITTEYEDKFRAAGLPIFSLEAVRVRRNNS